MRRRLSVVALACALGAVTLLPASAEAHRYGRIRPRFHAGFYPEAMLLAPGSWYVGVGAIATRIIDQSGGPAILDSGGGLTAWLGLRVSDPSKLEETLKQAFDYDGPVLVDVRVARLECVFPMVAPGGSIDEMLGGVPGCPVSEMLDDDLLEEVWE